MSANDNNTQDTSSEFVEREKSAVQEKTHKNLLFSTISYTDDSAYESFLKTMNVNQAVFVLIASANFAQAKGSFNLLESEVLATAIRVIKKTSAPETTSDNSDPVSADEASH